LPQDEQDELFDFYCEYGQFDAQGRSVGLFTRRAPVRDSAPLDVSWDDFQAKRIPQHIIAMTAPKRHASDRERAVDSFWSAFITQR
jgi:hypothetical protein